jgi:hypothetical protein
MKSTLIKLNAAVLCILFTTILNAQNIVINEYCPSNIYLTDEDNDTPDWIELYNNGESMVNLEGWHLSDDSSKLDLWTFPSVELPAKSYLMVFASGKDRLEIGTNYYPLVNYTDTFFYTIGSASIASSWKDLNFNASGWSKGIGGFGYGDNDDNTLIPEGTLSVFVRKVFMVENLEAVTQVLFDVDYDDGFVAYINGHEIARASLGTAGTEVPYSQAAESHEALIVNGSSPLRFDLTDFNDYLVEGKNVLCIQIHNTSSSSTDMTLIPFLTACSSIPGPGVVDKVLKLSKKYLHTNFKISSEGEAIYLSSPENKIIHQTDTLAIPSAVSRGLKPDGTGSWFFFAEPTPGRANSTTGYELSEGNQVTFTPKGGLFTSSVSVTLSTPSNGEIYYTTDGSIPDKTNTQYTGPIAISATTVVRAIAFSNTQLPGQPTTQSYILPDHPITLPIVSLTSDPYNLFDYNYGIYADGPGYTDADPHFGANYWMDWQRPVNIEYIIPDSGKVFESAGGIEIAGAWSRANAQKSFALKADKSYGSKSFRYHFFNSKNLDSFKSLVLRNSGNDWSCTGFRDDMMTGLVRNVDVDIQAYQPVVIYLNSQYWGILSLKEKINEDYLANNFNDVDADSVDMLEADASVIEGSADHYNQMMSYLNSNSMATVANYNYVKTQMDMNEYMEYMLAQIYYNNRDWPGNNIKFWRPQTTDGRWRWILYDTDFGFGIWGATDYSLNTLEFALDGTQTAWPNPAWSTLLFRKLVQSPVFVKDFANRFADRLNNEFLPATVVGFIDSLAGNIEDEIPYHIGKWQHMWDWAGNVENMRTYGKERPTYMFGYIAKQFNLGNKVLVKLKVSDQAGGYIQLNSLNIKLFPWSGYYFSKNPIDLRAVARPGYRFVKWQETGKTSVQLNITVTATTTFTAVFEPAETDYNSVVINEINYKSSDEQDTKDWVELFNTTDANIDISNWTINDAEGSKPFKFPMNTIISPKGFLVVCENKEKFKKYWPSVNPVVGNFAFGLGSAGESVRLFDADHFLIDSVTYTSDDPWPDDPNGKGVTLSLIDPYKDNNVAYRWEGSVKYGTPGAQNDNYNLVKSQVGASLVIASCYPNPFSDEAFISWEQPQAANTNIEFYDFQGRKVAGLANGWYPKGSFEISLKDNSNTATLTPGLYIVKINVEGYEQVVLKLIKE